MIAGIPPLRSPLARLALCLFILCGCRTPGDIDELERSFEFGQNRVPDTALQPGEFRALSEIREHPASWKTDVATKKLKPGARLPAVIYLHGCAGNTAGYQWAAQFNRWGYAFFAPDSLARPRRSLCGSGRSSMIRHRIPMRLQELEYALQQLRQLDWIDQQRLVLMGSSEGAQAASSYRGDAFAAVVLIGTDCRFVGGSPRTPVGIPVLNLVGSLDNEGGGNGCHIRGGTPGSRKVIVEGGYHKLGGNPHAHELLQQFLQQCCAALPRT